MIQPKIEEILQANKIIFISLHKWFQVRQPFAFKWRNKTSSSVDYANWINVNNWKMIFNGRKLINIIKEWLSMAAACSVLTISFEVSVWAQKLAGRWKWNLFPGQTSRRGSKDSEMKNYISSLFASKCRSRCFSIFPKFANRNCLQSFYFFQREKKFSAKFFRFAWKLPHKPDSRFHSTCSKSQQTLKFIMEFICAQEKWIKAHSNANEICLNWIEMKRNMNSNLTAFRVAVNVWFTERKLISFVRHLIDWRSLSVRYFTSRKIYEGLDGILEGVWGFGGLGFGGCEMVGVSKVWSHISSKNWVF